MENMLKQLFDFQKFEGNKELQRLIDATHGRYQARRELSLDEMEYVAAAGIPELRPDKKEPGEMSK